MTTFVNSLAKFTTRYHNSQSGVDASNWIASQATEAINNSNRTGVTVEKFANPWRQNSVIARIQGSDSGLKDEIIIFGAHMDSINSKNRFDIKLIKTMCRYHSSANINSLNSFEIFLRSYLAFGR